LNSSEYRFPLITNTCRFAFSVTLSGVYCIGGLPCFSLYHGSTQIGFGRAVTDSTTFTWVADIVVEPEFRGAGLGQWIMECLVAHPAIKGTQMVLQTRDAQGLYERFGFSGNSALMSTKVTAL